VRTLVKRLAPLFLLTMATVANCEQLYVRNRPYPGAVFKDSRGTRVDLETFLKMLNLVITKTPEGGWIVGEVPAEPPKAGALTINGEAVEVLQKDGHVFVAVEDLSKPLNLRVTHNAQLGTMDVSVVKPIAAPANEAATPSGGASTGVHRFQNPKLGISFWAPPNYALASDPAVLKNAIAEARKMVAIPTPLVKQGLEGFQFMCVDFKADDGKSKNDTLLMAVEQLPSSSIGSQEYLTANMQSTASTFPGTKLSGAPRHKKIGALDFLGQEYIRADPDGGKRLCRFFVAVEGNRGYVVQLAAQSVPVLNELEKLLDNLEIKGRL